MLLNLALGTAMRCAFSVSETMLSLSLCCTKSVYFPQCVHLLALLLSLKMIRRVHTRCPLDGMVRRQSNSVLKRLTPGTCLGSDPGLLEALLNP